MLSQSLAGSLQYHLSHKQVQGAQVLPRLIRRWLWLWWGHRLVTENPERTRLKINKSNCDTGSAVVCAPIGSSPWMWASRQVSKKIVETAEIHCTAVKLHRCVLIVWVVSELNSYECNWSLSFIHFRWLGHILDFKILIFFVWWKQTLLLNGFSTSQFPPRIIITGDRKLPVLGEKESQFAQSTHRDVWERVESYFTKWHSH